MSRVSGYLSALLFIIVALGILTLMAINSVSAEHQQALISILTAKQGHFFWAFTEILVVACVMFAFVSEILSFSIESSRFESLRVSSVWLDMALYAGLPMVFAASDFYQSLNGGSNAGMLISPMVYGVVFVTFGLGGALSFHVRQQVATGMRLLFSR